MLKNVMLKNEMFSAYEFGDSYEKFMTKHLQHYGFYSGNSRFVLRELEGYEKTHGYTPNDDSQSETQEESACVKNIEEIRIPRTTQLIYDIFNDGRSIPKLKAPHILHHDFVINLKQAPRWPVEMQVIPGKIVHIKAVPPHKEPIYEASGFEPRPQSKSEDKDNLVYEYNTFSGPFFIKSKFAPTTVSSNLKDSSNGLDSYSGDILQFESRFESGNLEKAYKVGPYEYELHLRTDMYTNKHTQWYYFRVTNTRANISYRFTIVNLYKADSLYNYGLKPLMYSEKDAQESNKGWRRCGSNIVYYRNNRRYSTVKGEKSFYSLTWSCSFPYDKDTIYFSHCYPYTYTDLMQYVDNIKNDARKKCFCQIKLLTHSLAENLSILLTITNPSHDSVLEKKKKIIVLTGRVHPGESNASWMMEGVLDYLLDDNPDAKLLRDLFIFKIVPMINPDGVIVGNYRCSLAGRDLNRNYKTQLRSSYPIIASIRTMVDRILKDREILFYCDLHGHSKKHNIFIYGCDNQVDERELLLERAFPALLNKTIPDKFDFQSCKFKMQKSKAGTGRIVFRNLGITHSFTIEASFCGSKLNVDKRNKDTRQYHFNTDDLKSIGEAFCSSLLDFCDPDQEKVSTIVASIREDLIKKYTSKWESSGVQVDFTKSSLVDLTQLDFSDDDSSDGDNGSDSSDSNGLPAHYAYMDKHLKVNKKNIPESKFKESKEDLKNKDLELLKKLQIGIRCSTCIHLSKDDRIPKRKSDTQKKLEKGKFVTGTPKFDVKNCEIKERPVLLRRLHTLDTTINDSPVESIKRSIQELETTKIELRYSGKTQNQANSNLDNVCEHLEPKVFSEDEHGHKLSSFVNPWKPPGNAVDNFCMHKPIKSKNGQRLKSGFLSKKIQELRLSPRSDYEGHSRSFGVFSQKPLNPIKRVQAMPLVRRQQQDSTGIEPKTLSDKTFFVCGIDP